MPGAAVQSRLVLPFLDLALLLLARYLQRFRQVDAQHAIVELGLDLRRIGIERQGDRAAERAIAAFHHMPVFILVFARHALSFSHRERSAFHW